MRKPVGQQKVKIPPFYFPEGKPLDTETLKENEEKINKAFDGKAELKLEEFDKVTTDVCGFPQFFKTELFNRIDTGKSGKVTKA